MKYDWNSDCYNLDRKKANEATGLLDSEENNKINFASAVMFTAFMDQT